MWPLQYFFHRALTIYWDDALKTLRNEFEDLISKINVLHDIDKKINRNRISQHENIITKKLKYHVRLFLIAPHKFSTGALKDRKKLK